MKARYTDFNGCHYFVLEDGTRVSFPSKDNVLCGRWNYAGDFTRFSEAQSDIFHSFVKTLGRPDAYDPCYVNIPEELLK